SDTSVCRNEKILAHPGATLRRYPPEVFGTPAGSNAGTGLQAWARRRCRPAWHPGHCPYPSAVGGWIAAVGGGPEKTAPGVEGGGDVFPGIIVVVRSHASRFFPNERLAATAQPGIGTGSHRASAGGKGAAAERIPITLGPRSQSRRYFPEGHPRPL